MRTRRMPTTYMLRFDTLPMVLNLDGTLTKEALQWRA